MSAGNVLDAPILRVPNVSSVTPKDMLSGDGALTVCVYDALALPPCPLPTVTLMVQFCGPPVEFAGAVQFGFAMSEKLKPPALGNVGHDAAHV